MIVINKKRLLNILGMVFISLFVFSFQIAKEEKTKETVSLPVSNKVIVIDAGHRSSRWAVQWAHHGATEAQTNLKIALKLQTLLEQSGSTVILTRSDENAIYDIDKNTLREKKISDIRNRVKIGN